MDGDADKNHDGALTEGTAIDDALREGVREALVRHKQADVPVVIYREGRSVWLDAAAVLAELDEADRPAR